jgi:hypothetical protein
MQDYDNYRQYDSDEDEQPSLNDPFQAEYDATSPTSHNEKLKKRHSEPMSAHSDKAAQPKVWLRSEYLANFGVQYNFTNIR